MVHIGQAFTSKMYGSLSKVILRLRLQMKLDWTYSGYLSLRSDWDQQIWEPETNLVLPYVNDLLPLFRALTDTQRTLETHFDAVKIVGKQLI